jgi:hypothetical protein
MISYISLHIVWVYMYLKLTRRLFTVVILHMHI